MLLCSLRGACCRRTERAAHAEDGCCRRIGAATEHPPGAHGCCNFVSLKTSPRLSQFCWRSFALPCTLRCPPPPRRCAAVQIKFFKSTMFRKTIETKSLSETRHVWESFIDMTKDAVRQRQPGG